jgi:hypothetical protein
MKQANAVLANKAIDRGANGSKAMQKAGNGIISNTKTAFQSPGQLG